MAAAAAPLECFFLTANTGPEEAGAVHLPDLPLPVLMQEMVQRFYAGVLLQPLVTSMCTLVLATNITGLKPSRL